MSKSKNVNDGSVRSLNDAKVTEICKAYLLHGDAAVAYNLVFPNAQPKTCEERGPRVVASARGKRLLAQLQAADPDAEMTRIAIELARDMKLTAKERLEAVKAYTALRKGGVATGDKGDEPEPGAGSLLAALQEMRGGKA